MKIAGRRGRPMGYRLSEASKRSISLAKIGQRHKQETKDKISRSLTVYFRNRNLLSNELADMYCRMEDDRLCGWVYSFSDSIDLIDDVLPTKMLNNKRKMELAYGDCIEGAKHSMTPEFLLILKEEVMMSDGNVENARMICECVL